MSSGVFFKGGPAPGARAPRSEKTPASQGTRGLGASSKPAQDSGHHASDVVLKRRIEQRRARAAQDDEEAGDAVELADSSVEGSAIEGGRASAFGSEKQRFKNLSGGAATGAKRPPKGSKEKAQPKPVSSKASVEEQAPPVSPSSAAPTDPAAGEKRARDEVEDEGDAVEDETGGDAASTAPQKAKKRRKKVRSRQKNIRKCVGDVPRLFARAPRRTREAEPERGGGVGGARGESERSDREPPVRHN